MLADTAALPLHGYNHSFALQGGRKSGHTSRTTSKEVFISGIDPEMCNESVTLC